MPENLLNKNQLKATPQRIAIIKEIMKAGHIDIHELHKRLILYFPSISLATVYKNIDTLLESSIIKELNVAHQKKKYELLQSSHAHMVCTVCGKITDVQINTDCIVEQIKDKKFHYHSCDVYFYGICDECSKK